MSFRSPRFGSYWPPRSPWSATDPELVIRVRPAGDGYVYASVSWERLAASGNWIEFDFRSWHRFPGTAPDVTRALVAAMAVVAAAERKVAQGDQGESASR
jgi:hypothetical protein